MKLERFNQHGKFIEFDPAHGQCDEVHIASSEPSKGIADLLGNSCVALVGKENGLVLYLNRVEFNLMDPSIELHYKHKEDGTSVFMARDAMKSETLVYKSWWRRSAPGVAAFGTADDEDEDICAYIIFMTKAANRSAHLIRKYN